MTPERERHSLVALDRSGCSQAARGAGADLTCCVSDGRGDRWAVVPELDNVIANLELMPLKMNEGKKAKVGARQLGLARKLEKAGLLSADGRARWRASGSEWVARAPAASS